MRLFPPVPYMSRRTTMTETLNGHDFRPGTILFIPIYALHRHKRLWTNPERFDISRFLDGGEKAIARTAFLPFGAGPRICLGASLAMMEMSIGLATLLKAVRFERVSGFAPDPVARITLRPRNGITVRIASAV